MSGSEQRKELGGILEERGGGYRNFAARCWRKRRDTTTTKIAGVGIGANLGKDLDQAHFGQGTLNNFLLAWYSFLKGDSYDKRSC